MLKKKNKKVEKNVDNELVSANELLKAEIESLKLQLADATSKLEKIQKQLEKQGIELEPEVEPTSKKSPSGKYELFEDEATNMFKYILKASNGEKLIESELYSKKDSAKGAIESLKRNLETGKFSISQDKSKFFQFKLTASNNRQMAVSANYSSKQNAEKALESFKRFALNSPVVEVEAPKDYLMEEITVEKTDVQVNGSIKITSDEEGWTFRLHANNGELLCSSKPYSTKSNCEEAVETLKVSVTEGKFFVFKDKNKLFQFRLQTQAKRLIAVGQTYEDKQRAISSAVSVASFIDKAKIEVIQE